MGVLTTRAKLVLNSGIRNLSVCILMPLEPSACGGLRIELPKMSLNWKGAVHCVKDWKGLPTQVVVPLGG